MLTSQKTSRSFFFLKKKKASKACRNSNICNSAVSSGGMVWTTRASPLGKKTPWGSCHRTPPFAHGNWLPH